MHIRWLKKTNTKVINLFVNYSNTSCRASLQIIYLGYMCRTVKIQSYHDEININSTLIQHAQKLNRGAGATSVAARRTDPRACEAASELKTNRLNPKLRSYQTGYNFALRPTCLFPGYKAGRFAPASKPTWTLSPGLHIEFVYKNIIIKTHITS